MATVISKEEAYAHLADVVDRAMGGEEIEIEQGGRVALKLVPVENVALPAGQRRPGTLAGLITEMPGVWDPLTDDELKEMGL